MSSNYPRLLSLDIATKCGYCYGRLDERPEFGSTLYGVPKGSPSGAVFAGALEWSMEIFGAENIHEAVFEETLDPRHLKQTTKSTMLRLMGLPAVIESVAYLHHVYKFSPINAGKVRFWLLGKRVKKAEAKLLILEAVKALGYDCGDDDDAADAVAIWHYKRHLMLEAMK